MGFFRTRIFMQGLTLLKLTVQLFVKFNLIYKQEVIKAISDLGQKIGSITIAEGVETEQEVVTCVECGVDWFQGYFFSPAIPSDAVNTLSFKEQCSRIPSYIRKNL